MPGAGAQQAEFGAMSQAMTNGGTEALRRSPIVPPPAPASVERPVMAYALWFWLEPTDARRDAFNRIKQYRRVAIRYDKLAANELMSPALVETLRGNRRVAIVVDRD
jgi:hypothetical protein